MINISATEEIQLKEQVTRKAKNPKLTGKSKIKHELLVGDDLHHKSGKWNKKTRIIDRENNKYLEAVTDPKTGEVVHHCEEPLSDHFGHGSAKKPPATDD